VLPLRDDFAVVEPPAGARTGVGEERPAAVDVDGPAPVVFFLVALEGGDDELAYVGGPHPSAHEGPSLPQDPVARVDGRRAEDQGDQDSAEDALHGWDDSRWVGIGERVSRSANKRVIIPSEQVIE